MIRPFVQSDLEELLDVWYRASRQAHPFLSEEFLQAEQARIGEEWLPRSKTFVAELNGRVVGFLSLVGDEIGGLFVDPEHQRRGHGRDLVDEARTVLPFPELTVFEANAGARAFYERYGFVAVGRRVNDDTNVPELVMRFSGQPPE